MSKKRGLSLEEKRQKMLEIFFEKKEFFHLKEIEKIAPKEKGITPMSVKDVLQSLVDDDMVNCEKVGASSYYWAFPSQAVNCRMNKISSLRKKLDESENKLKAVTAEMKRAAEERVPNEERTRALAQLSKLKAEHLEVMNKLEEHKENDPETIEKLIRSSTDLKDAANRWTDNLFMLKSWIKKKFPVDETQMNKQFEIPDDLDYIE